MNEWRLLREYVDHNSQAAFAALVERYIHLVYSTCLRELRDPSLAEDVTQVVFLILARKAARLREGTILSGWLYQTSRFAARNAMQQEARRQHYEQQTVGEAIEEMIHVMVPGDYAEWQGLEPLLHDALDSLNASDRHAVLLRFFDDKSLKETGEALHISEEAARKRVARALDKMRRYFSAHGVAVSGVVLATLLSTKALQAAPQTCIAATLQATSGAALHVMTVEMVGAKVYSLWQGTMHAMLMNKAVVTAGLILGAGLAGTGAGKLLQMSQTKSPPQQSFVKNIVRSKTSLTPRSTQRSKPASVQVNKAIVAKPIVTTSPIPLLPTTPRFTPWKPALVPASDNSPDFAVRLIPLPHITTRPNSTKAPAANVQKAEIQVEGTISEINITDGTFTLSVTSFTTPNGKTGRIPSSKPKTIVVGADTKIYMRDDARQTVTLEQLQMGAPVIAICDDLGSGKKLPARKIIVWNIAPPETKRPVEEGIPELGVERPEMLLQVGHTGEINALNFSPDGSLLASSSPRDRSVKVWNAASRELLWTLPEQQTPFFLPEINQMATVDFPKRINFWDTRTGELIRTLWIEGQGGLGAVTLSPDGRTIAAGCKSEVLIFDAVSGQELQALPAKLPPNFTLAYSPDSNLLASKDPNTIKVWNLHTGTLLHTMQHGDEVGAIAFSPDGKLLASGSEDTFIRLWDMGNGQLVRTLGGQVGSTRSLQFSPDSSALATCTYYKITVWNPHTGELQKSIGSLETNGPKIVAFSPRLAVPEKPSVRTAANVELANLYRTTIPKESAEPGYRLAVGGDYHITLWDDRHEEAVGKLRGVRVSANLIAVAARGQRLFSQGTSGVIRLWDTTSGELLQTVAQQQAMLAENFIANSNDGRIIVIIDYPGAFIRVWDPIQPKLLRRVRLEGMSGGKIFPQASVLSLDGQTLAVAYDDNLIRLWNVDTGELKQTLRGHTGVAIVMAFTPDGKSFVSSATDKTLRLWDVTTGQLKSTQHDNFPITAVAFSPDGKTLASSTESYSRIDLRSAETGQWQRSLHVRRAAKISSIAFSDDGKTLLANNNAGLVYEGIWVWDVESGQAKRTPMIGDGQVESVAFSADGTGAICGMRGGWIKIWDLQSGKLRATMMVLTNNYLDNLATDEWIAYTPEGYYTASPGAAEFIRWRVSGKLVPAGKFAKQFHRPDLVNKALKRDTTLSAALSKSTH